MPDVIGLHLIYVYPTNYKAILDDDDDDDDDELYIPTPLVKPGDPPCPPTQRKERHTSKVIGVKEANAAPQEGIQLDEWGALPEIAENESILKPNPKFSF